MGKVFVGERNIVIPKDTLVLICGSQRSGKTTFVKKHFSAETVIDTDEIFNGIVEKEATIFDTYETLFEKVSSRFEKMVIKSSGEDSVTVVDAAPIEFENRVEMLNRFKGLHANIVLIVLNVGFNTLNSRPKKVISEKKKKYDLYSATSQELLYNCVVLSEQIKKGQIGYKTNKTYILSEQDIARCQITFE